MVVPKMEPRTSARPLAQHRMHGAASTGAPMSQWQSRRHSHTLAAAAGTGPAPHSHRVTRRRSMSMANGNHMAAVVAAVQNAALGDPDASGVASMSARRSVAAKAADGDTASANGSYSVEMEDAAPSGISHADDVRHDAVPEEQSPFVLSRPASKPGAKARSRRASEGAHLRMHGGRRESGNELRCETCGKAYKHGSCLTKHLWEHTPEWSYTSKLLMSKHQQVQLLEAASVLVSMNQEGNPSSTADATSDAPSYHSSASPPPTASSASRDGLSSVHTTPPPAAPAEDEYGFLRSVREFRAPSAKRRSSYGSSYSRSHYSVPSTATYTDATSPGTPGFYRPGHNAGDVNAAAAAAAVVAAAARLASASVSDEDEAGLAAAVSLLSCSHGTPRSAAVVMSDDVPPVPPLPARFAGRAAAAPSHESVSFGGGTGRAGVGQAGDQVGFSGALHSRGPLPQSHVQSQLQAQSGGGFRGPPSSASFFASSSAATTAWRLDDGQGSSAIEEESSDGQAASDNSHNNNNNRGDEGEEEEEEGLFGRMEE